MPKVEKVSIRVAARPLAPLEAGDTTGQPEYLSTSTRYADPSWWKKSAQMCWKGYSDWIGVIQGPQAYANSHINMRKATPICEKSEKYAK